MSEKKKYNPELKAEAIKLVNEQGLTQAEVSQRLGIPFWE
jgi:transposase-like protein